MFAQPPSPRNKGQSPCCAQPDQRPQAAIIAGLLGGAAAFTVLAPLLGVVRRDELRSLLARGRPV
jgi:hypothetical protein